MSIRTILQEYEAKLTAINSGAWFFKPAGKMERKKYGDGHKRLKVVFRRFKVPDGQQVDIFINDQLIGKVAVKQGTGRYELLSENGDTVPEISPDDVAEIRYLDQVIVRGIFYLD